MKKIIILGSGGYIGSQIYTFLSRVCGYVVVGIDLAITATVDITCDVSDYQDLTRIFLEVQPDIIIHSAAVKDLLTCEQNRQYAWNVNAYSCYIVSDFARENDVKILYISSDVVFDGVIGNYSEYDCPAPINVYGLTKFCGELIIKQLSNSAICRTALVIGDLTEEYIPLLAQSLKSNVLSNQTLLPHYIYSKLKKNEEVNLPDEYVSSPTSMSLLINGVYNIIQKNVSGVFHLAGPTALSRYEFGVKLAQFHGLNQSLIIKTIGENTKIRPKNLSMNINSTFDQLGLLEEVYDLDVVFKTIKWINL